MYIDLLYIAFISLFIILAIEVASCILSLLSRIHYSEYKRSIIGQISTKFKSPRHVHFRYVFSITILLTLTLSCLYPVFFCYLLIPIICLLLFDLLFLSIIIPQIKKLVFNLNISTLYIDRKFLFKEQFFSGQLQIPPKYSEYFVLALPLNLKADTTGDNLLELKNFIWIWRLYKQRQIKHYMYFLFIVSTETLFLLLFYKFYFYELLNIRAGLYAFLFLLIWVLYIIAQLRSLLGLHYFLDLFTDYQKKFDLKQIATYLTIYQKDNFSGELKPYDVKIILKEIQDIKNILIKSLDFFIGLVTTVLFIAVLTFILAYK